LNRLKIVLDVLAPLSSSSFGIGVYAEGITRIVGGSDCTAWEQLRRLLGSHAKKEIASRLSMIADVEGQSSISLPFGMKATSFSLRKVLGCSAAVFVLTEVDRSHLSADDVAVLNAQPRKGKKHLSQIIGSMGSYRHPDPDGLNGLFITVAAEIGQAHDEWRETAFTNTLASYKDFVSSFCHEALSPMQEVQTVLELTLKDSGIDLAAEKRLRSSLRSLEGLRVSLEGMRLLFRDDHRQPLPNQFREIDLQKIVRRWVSGYQSQFDEKNINVIVEPASKSWKLNCVPEYIEILIKNLVSNGAKYSFDASGFDDGEGKFLVRFDQRQLRLSVVNFGVPISSDEIESGALFERDTRGGSANDRGRVGKGVGLHLVKRVAELHDATINVKSVVQNPGGSQRFARTEFDVQFRAKP